MDFLTARVVDSSSDKNLSQKQTIETHLNLAIIIGHEIIEIEYELISLPNKLAGKTRVLMAER